MFRRVGLRSIVVVSLAAASMCVSSPASAQTCDVLRQSWEGVPWDASINPRRHPPDPSGAAGPAGVLAAVNIRLSYYDKNGTLRWGPVCYRNFFPAITNSGCEPILSGGPLGHQWASYVTDPRALYDPRTRRFYVITAEEYIVNQDSQGSHSYLNVAVSRDSSPTTGDATSWVTQQIDITSVFPNCRLGDDYPGLAVDDQALYVTYNPASLVDECSGVTSGAHVIAIDKASLLTSPIWTMTYPEAGTTLPVSVWGSTGPGNVAYFLDLTSGNPPHVRLWALSNPLSAGRTMTSAEITVPAIGSGAGSAPQPCDPLDTRGGWPQGNAFWHDGSVRFVMTGGNGSLPDVRYYRIATNGFPNGTPSLLEAKQLTGSDAWFQPAIGGNDRGDEGIVFNRSSATDPPSIWFTWRRDGETDFHAPVLVKASPTCYSSSDNPERWGDYASVTADPADQSFWLSHEWAKGSGVKEWGTWWANLAPCLAPIALSTLSPTGKKTIMLGWTEPAGAVSYDLRYSTGFIADTNFATRPHPITQPSPAGEPGAPMCFTMYNLQSCKQYCFALKWTDAAGVTSLMSNVPIATTRCSGVDVLCTDGGASARAVQPAEEAPAPGALLAPAPVPSVSFADIRYEVSAVGAGDDLDLSVFDVAGRRLRTLERGTAAVGAHHFKWDLASDNGDRLRPGTYLLRLRVGAW